MFEPYVIRTARVEIFDFIFPILYTHMLPLLNRVMDI